MYHASKTLIKFLVFQKVLLEFSLKCQLLSIISKKFIFGHIEVKVGEKLILLKRLTFLSTDCKYHKYHLEIHSADNY